MFRIFREINLLKGEHHKEEFKAINPVSTVPALVDSDGTKVFDSSAIAIYLVGKYAKDDALYPSEFMLRTKVNERLFYVGSYIFPRIYQIFVPAFYGRADLPEWKIAEIIRGYQTIEGFLDGSEYLAGSTLTLPDLYLWTSMESLSRVVPIDEEKFPNFTRWLSKMRELPFYEENKKGAEDQAVFYQSCLAKAAEKKAEN